MHHLLQHAGVLKGALVPVMDPSTNQLSLLSLATVGHAIIDRKAQVIGRNDEPIKPKVRRIRRDGATSPEFAEVIDPGDQYRVAFDLHAPYGHLAMVDKT